MNTYITAYPTNPLGRWLAALAVSLVLLALAYAQAPDPAGQLGLNTPSALTLPSGRLAQEERSHRLAPGHVLASAQVSRPASMAAHTQFAR